LARAGMGAPRGLGTFGVGQGGSGTDKQAKRRARRLDVAAPASDISRARHAARRSCNGTGRGVGRAADGSNSQGWLGCWEILAWRLGALGARGRGAGTVRL